eukprot:910226_1
MTVAPSENNLLYLRSENASCVAEIYIRGHNFGSYPRTSNIFLATPGPHSHQAVARPLWYRMHLRLGSPLDPRAFLATRDSGSDSDSDSGSVSTLTGRNETQYGCVGSKTLHLTLLAPVVVKNYTNSSFKICPKAITNVSSEEHLVAKRECRGRSFFWSEKERGLFTVGFWMKSKFFWTPPIRGDTESAHDVDVFSDPVKLECVDGEPQTYETVSLRCVVVVVPNEFSTIISVRPKFIVHNRCEVPLNFTQSIQPSGECAQPRALSPGGLTRLTQWKFRHERTKADHVPQSLRFRVSFGDVEGIDSDGSSLSSEICISGSNVQGHGRRHVLVRNPDTGSDSLLSYTVLQHLG